METVLPWMSCSCLEVHAATCWRTFVPAQPLRQWVFELALCLAAPLAYEPGLIGVVARVFADSLLRWYRTALGTEPMGRHKADC